MLMRSSLEESMALETNMANSTEPTQKCQKLSMACTVHSALAGHPSDNQLPIEKLCPCDLTDTYQVKTMRQYGPIGLEARGAVVLCWVRGEE
jgi:hypothetical protein